MSRQRISEAPQHKATEEKQTLRNEMTAPQSDLSTGQRSMLAAQQSVGNQAVIRRMMEQNAVQRIVALDEVSTSVDSPANPAPVDAGAGTPAAAGGGQSSISGPGGSVSVEGGGVAINSNGPISLNAASVTATGMIQTPTLMADQVIGASYTPGAGNVW